MSTAEMLPLTPPEEGPSRVDIFKGMKPKTKAFFIAGTLLVLLSLTRVITDATDLTSSGTFETTLRVTTPILLAGLAGLWAERSGIVNIGIEGMMILGTWFGAWGAWKFGPWTGLALGIVAGSMGGLLHALAVVKYNVNHVISGVAINLLAAGSMRYMSDRVFTGADGGGISQSPRQKSAIPQFDVPFLGGGKIFGWKSPDMLGWLEGKRWFLVSDAAGMARGLVTSLSWGSVLGLVLLAASGWVLWRTRFGLRARSSGEAPSAAESLGVKVIRLRYAGLAISGAMAGLGGAYLSIISSAYYREGQTAGRGYIGLATMIFGNWRPAGLLGGATLFGFTDALRLRRDDSLPALFLFFSFIAGLWVIYSLVKKRAVHAGAGLAAAVLFWYTYDRVTRVPESLTQMAPYLMTLIVLAVASQRLRPPAHAGLPFRSGEDH
jgi:simple sugar transport system permease protein